MNIRLYCNTIPIVMVVRLAEAACRQKFLESVLWFGIMDVNFFRSDKKEQRKCHSIIGMAEEDKHSRK